MEEILRCGVVGAGVFGGHHARKYASLPGAVLSGVYDPNPERAASLVMPLGGRAFSDLDAFLEAVDVVSLASPATVHAEQALRALAAGKSVYVEKPIATSVADAWKIVDLARQQGLVVAAGHQERVLFEAMGLLGLAERPLFMEAVRHGPPSGRSLDVSVVLDLMIHDLDLALALSGSEPVAAEGDGTVSEQGLWDEARSEVTFAGGLIARFDVSRQAPERRRTMRLVYAEGEVEIDFLTRAFRNTTGFDLNPGFADTAQAKDTLGASIARFLDAVRGRGQVVVDAVAATQALDLALAVEQGLEG